MDDIDERLGPPVDPTRLDAKIHAGEILRGWIEDNGETVAGTARRLGMSRGGLNRVLSGQGRMAARLALEGIGWSRARFWMDLQTSHEIARLRLALDADAA